MKIFNLSFKAMLSIICTIIWINIVSAAFVSAQHQIFVSDSLKHIESHYSGKAFLMILWSTDCLPCRAELALLGQLKREYSELNLVLVSTDAFAQRELLDKILTEHSLEKTNKWAFKQANSLALRNAIDADWYGELPRSYFFDATHQRIGLSGSLTRKQILTWLKLQQPQ